MLICLHGISYYAFYMLSLTYMPLAWSASCILINVYTLHHFSARLEYLVVMSKQLDMLHMLSGNMEYVACHEKCHTGVLLTMRG